MDALEELLSTIPGYANLTLGMKQQALSSASIPDSTGLWPGQDGYTPTYDAFYAAYLLIPFLRAHPVVINASSEGTSVAVQAPDWGSLAAYLLSMSHIAQTTGQTILQRVAIPDTSDVKRVYMGNRGDGSDDTDTTLG